MGLSFNKLNTLPLMNHRIVKLYTIHTLELVGSLKMRQIMWNLQAAEFE